MAKSDSRSQSFANSLSIPSRCFANASAATGSASGLLFGALLSSSLAVLTADSAAAVLLYRDTFDSPRTIAPGVTLVDTGNGAQENAVSFGSWTGLYYANRSVSPALPSTLFFSNLPPHTSIDIDFILGFLESWDSSNGLASPDYLMLEVDGVRILDGLTSNNASGSVVNFGGGTPLALNVQANNNGFYSDTLIDMSSVSALSFPHTANTLNISMLAYGDGWQGGLDEAWGVDNIVITYEPKQNPTAVPGPVPGLGVAAALAFARRLRHHKDCSGARCSQDPSNAVHSNRS